MPLNTPERPVVSLALLLAMAATACRGDGPTTPPPQDGHTGAVRNSPPASDPGGPYASTDGVLRVHGGRSADVDGDPLRYVWDFGDGIRDTGIAPVHTYLGDALYTVTLTVFDGRGDSGIASTTATVNRAGSAIVIAGAGRIARCGSANAAATARLLDDIPGLVFVGGDNALPHGSVGDYKACYHPTWGRHRARTFAVLGNHEYDLGHAGAAFGYFGPHAGPRDLGYYGFHLGDWHVVVLNDRDGHVPYGAGSTQERWLRTVLAGSTRRCTIAFWHMPLFLSSNTAAFTENGPRRALWNALHAAGADVVVNANSHHYERLAPLRPDGTRDDSAGIRSFNVGTGGESLSLPTVAIHEHSEVRSAVHGVFKLTLYADRYDWEFVPVPGQSFRDAGSGICH